MRGVACVIPGTLEIEGRKRASELISEVTGDPEWARGGCQVCFPSRGAIAFLLTAKTSYMLHPLP